MLRNLIWDFDGTLYDSYQVINRVMRDALSARGIEAPIDEINTLMHDTMGAAVRFYRENYGLEPTFEEEFGALIRREPVSSYRPMPGMPELLRDLKEAGYTHDIYTHRDRGIHDMLALYLPEDTFRSVVTSESGLARKPAPDGVLYLLERYGLDPDETVMIGDRQLDLDCAHAAGIRGIAFTDGFNPPITGAEYTAKGSEGLRKLLL